jgi:hypothetical protein
MSGSAPSENLDRLIAELGDWRGEMIQRIRRLMNKTDPEIVLEWKWMGTPVWSHDGMVALANPHKGKVKLTFAQGAKLPDPAELFNADLEGNKWRAVDIFETDTLNEPALQDLVRAAVAFNQARMAERAGAPARRPSKTLRKKRVRVK